jgi:hypothetical protein
MPDLNKDGLSDLFFYSGGDYLTEVSGTPTLFSALGVATGTYAGVVSEATPYIGTPLTSISYRQKGPNNQYSLTADLNGDGFPDVIAFQMPGLDMRHSYAQIMMNNGDGALVPTYNIMDLTGQTIPRYAVDVNHDGRQDLIEWDGASSSMQVIKGYICSVISA